MEIVSLGIMLVSVYLLYEIWKIVFRVLKEISQKSEQFAIVAITAPILVSIRL